MLWSSLLYTRWGNTWTSPFATGVWGTPTATSTPTSQWPTATSGRTIRADQLALAPISRLWPGSLWTLWIQDLMVVGGELAPCIWWSTRATPRWPVVFRADGMVGLVAVLLVANPWIYDSISFDFRYQSVGAACFAMLACREMIGGRLSSLSYGSCCVSPAGTSRARPRSG